jgi:hypothetical protein
VYISLKRLREYYFNLNIFSYLPAEFIRGPHGEARRASECYCRFAKRRDTGISIVTRLKGGQPINLGSVPRRVSFFFLSLHTGSVAHAASHEMGTRFFPQRERGLIVKLATYLYLVPKLRIKGVVPPLLHSSTLPVPN